MEQNVLKTEEIYEKIHEIFYCNLHLGLNICTFILESEIKGQLKEDGNVFKVSFK